MTEDENKFYESIRSILNEGTEEVPEGLWDAIESRLPAARPRIIPVFLKILAPTAAAAAVVTAVLLSPLGNNTSPAYDHTIARLDESGYGNPAAVIAAVPQAAALRNDVFVITDAATASSAADSPVQEETVGHDISARDAGEGSAKDSGAVQVRGPETAEAAVPATDKTSGQRTKEADDLFGFDFPDEEESGPRNRIRTAVTLSGNAISNTNSTRSNADRVPMSFRPSQKTELKGDEGWVGVETDSLAACVGQVVTAATEMCPSGKVEYGERQYEAVMEYGSANAGERLKVIRAEGGRLYCVRLSQ